MARCVHGFVPDQCMICETLASLPRSMAGHGPMTTTAPEAERGDPPRRQWPGGRRQGGPLGTVDRATVARHRSYHPVATAVLVVVAVVAVIAAIFVVVGVVFAILRLLEVVVVAIAAGWIGYRAGHWRGRHDV